MGFTKRRIFTCCRCAGERGRRGAISFNFMHIAEHASRDAHDQHRQISPRPVPGAAWNIDDDAFVQLNLFAVEQHRPFARKNVVVF